MGIKPDIAPKAEAKLSLAAAETAEPQSAGARPGPRAAAPPGDRLELIETFIRIAETGGIGAAARVLDTTQPTVTRRLQQLESMLDAKLVDRGPQGLSLTPVGATLLPEAREMAARWRRLEHVARDDDGALVGPVRVHGDGELAARLLPPLIAAFLRAHPDVRIDARFRDSTLDLASDGADFAVVEGKPSAEGLAIQEIGRSRMVLVAAPEFADPLADARGVSALRCEPLALEGAPLITTTARFGSSIRFQGRNGDVEDAPFEVVAVVEHIDAALMLALEGCGIALLPDWRVAGFIEAERLRRLAVDWSAGETPVCVAWSPARLRSASATALLELVKQELPRRLA